MTEYKIEEQAGGVQIQLLNALDNKEELIDGFGACASGACACSTEEFKKVESMKVSSEGSTITVDVKTKAGEVIDQSCISDCITEMTAASNQSCC